MILDGKGLAKINEQSLIEKVKTLKDRYGRVPSLSVILVGESAPSMAYVSSKKKACLRVGIDAEIIHLSDQISELELLKVIDNLNYNDNIDGILVQLPLPKHIDTEKVVNHVAPFKDVDGLHTLNGGKLFTKQDGIRPATPLGVMMLLDHYNIDYVGKHAVIVGRSNLVGMPLAKLLLDRDATITVVHRRTPNVEFYTKQADILLVAVGIPNYIKKHMVKPGAIVVDVGINRIDGKLVGDVDFEGVKDHVSWITPVPGGVGPMTISALLYNVIKQYEDKQND